MSKKIVILGLGNILLKDEGVGVHVVNEILKKKVPVNVEVIDGGTSGLDVLLSSGNIDRLFVIDALKSGSRPAAVHRLEPGDIAAPGGDRISMHQVGLPDALESAKKLGIRIGKVVIFGVEPGDVGPGTEMTPELKEKAPDIAEMVLKEAGNDCE